MPNPKRFCEEVGKILTMAKKVDYSGNADAVAKFMIPKTVATILNLTPTNYPNKPHLISKSYFVTKTTNVV